MAKHRVENVEYRRLMGYFAVTEPFDGLPRSVELVQRTVTFTSTAWEKTTVDAVDLAEEAAFSVQRAADEAQRTGKWPGRIAD